MSKNINPYGPTALVGMRFIPTDEELVGYFLLRKILGVAIPETFVLECDLYGDENPWQIWQKFSSCITFNPSDGSQDLYFFTKLKRKKPNAIRVERRVGIGAWQGEDGKNLIMSQTTSHVCIGSKKRLRFEKSGTNHDGEWIMHEYSLSASLLPPNFPQSIVNELGLCRIRKNQNVSTDQSNKSDNNRKKSSKHNEFDHSLSTSLLPHGISNSTVNESVQCQIRKNEHVNTDQSNKNNNKRKKSSKHDDVDQSQCKLKKSRQQDLEPILNHVEPEKLDEENLLFATDLERELLEFDQGTKQSEARNTLFSMEELFPNDLSSEEALLNSTESNETEAMGLNENDHYSPKVDEETLLFAADLEKELLEFDQGTKQSEPDNSLFSMEESFPNDLSSEEAPVKSRESNETEAMGLNENDHYSPKVDEGTLLFAADLEKELLEFDQEPKQSDLSENSNKIQDKTCTQEDDLDLVIDIDELLNLPEDFFKQLGDISPRI